MKNDIILSMKRIAKTVEETQILARKLAENIEIGTIILLNGDLGVGKTTFTQGFAYALGIKQSLKSPTFNLVREYETSNFILYHFDVYRLGEEGGVYELGLEEYFRSDSIVLIEWPEYIENILPNDVIKVDIKRLSENENFRSIEISSTSSKWVNMIKNL